MPISRCCPVQAELLPHLPPGQQSAEFLESTVRSPQLTQAITALDEALQGGNYGAVVSNFGIDPSPGTAALVSHIVRRVCWTVLYILLYASFTSTVIFVIGLRRGHRFRRGGYVPSLLELSFLTFVHSSQDFDGFIFDVVLNTIFVS